MAGLLDFLNTDEAQLGIALLSAGGYSDRPMSFGQRLGGALGSYNQQRGAAEDKAMRKQLLQSQIGENEMQAKLRQSKIADAERQAAFDAQFTGAGGVGSGPAGQGGATPAGNAPAGTGAMTAAAISQRYGIPLDQVIADYKFNDGKKIAEFIGKSREANWVNVNGNLVNTNAQGFEGGVQGGVAAGNDGRVTAWQPDGRGGLVVGAPRGALETYGAFQDLNARTGAAYAAGRPVLDDNGRLRPQSLLAEVGGASPSPMIGPGAGVPASGRGSYGTEASLRSNNTSDWGADPRALQRELAALRQDYAKVPDPASRQAIQQQITALEGQALRYGTTAPPSPPMIGPGAGRGAVNPTFASAAGAIDFSPAEKAAQEAERTRGVEQAKADVARGKGTQDASKRMDQMQQAAKLARELLDKDPTQSGIGALADKAMDFAGQPTPSGTVAQQLENLGGWLVANVPRMEGPQSDRDVLNYQTMAGRVGDRTLPVASRKAALGTLMELQKKYGEINDNAGEPKAAEAKPARRVVDTLPAANTSNKGQRIRDTSTGKILRSDGMQWKEE